MVLDILAHNNWERPVYFAVTVSPDNFLNLREYFQTDGLAYRVVPLKASQTGGIDTDKLYDKMMNQFRWGNISDPRVYLCETNTRLISHFRHNFGQLAAALVAENKIDSAVRVLDRAYEVIPTYQISLSYADLTHLEQYYRAGKKEKENALLWYPQGEIKSVSTKATEKGSALAENLFNTISEELYYYMSFPKNLQNSIRNEIQNRRYVLLHTCDLARQYDRSLFDTLRAQWDAMFPHERLDMMFQQMMFDEEEE